MSVSRGVPCLLFIPSALCGGFVMLVCSAAHSSSSTTGLGNPGLEESAKAYPLVQPRGT